MDNIPKTYKIENWSFYSAGVDLAVLVALGLAKEVPADMERKPATRLTVKPESIETMEDLDRLNRAMLVNNPMLTQEC